MEHGVTPSLCTLTFWMNTFVAIIRHLARQLILLQLTKTKHFIHSSSNQLSVATSASGKWSQRESEKCLAMMFHSHYCYSITKWHGTSSCIWLSWAWSIWFLAGHRLSSNSSTIWLECSSLKESITSNTTDLSEWKMLMEFMNQFQRCTLGIQNLELFYSDFRGIVIIMLTASDQCKFLEGSMMPQLFHLNTCTQSSFAQSHHFGSTL